MSDKKFNAKQATNKSELRKTKSEIHNRQTALCKVYTESPEKAAVIDWAIVEGKNLSDPFRTEVVLNSELKMPVQIGVHRAVGGNHDYPNPGDLLCASLAACVESTLRIIANRLEIELFKTAITVTAEIDVRGTLVVDKTVPVGFQSMHIVMEVGARNQSDQMINSLINATKRSCIVYQTLKKGLPITKEVIIVKEK